MTTSTSVIDDVLTIDEPPELPRRDYRNLVIEQLADDEAELRDLVDVLLREHAVLREIAEIEILRRIHAEGIIARQRRRLDELLGRGGQR